MAKTIEFTKMHGAGNDYIYVNTDIYPIEDPSALSVKWSKYHTGIGSDGLILISHSSVADYKMRIFNADGSEAMMCGNGTRCVGKFVYDKRLTDKTHISLETMSGIKYIDLKLTDGKVWGASVDMGMPEILSLGPDPTPFVDREITAEGTTMRGTAVSMGNPHLVFFVNDVEKMDIAAIGPKFERHPWYRDRTNVEFAEVLSPRVIRMRVWERGSGITMACGTGACATYVAAMANRLTDGPTSLILDGGTLEITQNESGNIIMTGPAETVYEGRITY